MARQDGNVLTTFAQAGQTDPDHIEAVEQIFAEQSLLDARLEILVRRGNDANVGPDR